MCAWPAALASQEQPLFWNSRFWRESPGPQALPESVYPCNTKNGHLTKFYVTVFVEFPAILSNTFFGKSAGNLRHFVKNDLQISKFLSKIFPI